MLLTKLAVGVFSAVLSAYVLRSHALLALSERRFRTLLWCTVLPGYAVLAAILHGTRASADLSDASGYYYPAALEALAGKLVYRDFPSSYAPLFSYLAALCVALWNDPRVFCVAAILLHAIGLRVWLGAATGRVDATALRRAAALVAVNGHVLINVLVGQNQVWVAAFVALSAALAWRGRAFASGAVLGAGLASVKLLAIVFAASLWPAATHRARWLLGFALVALGMHGAFAFAGADVWMPIRLEGPLATSGNLPFLLSVVGLDPGGAAGLVLTAAGIVLGATVAWRSLTELPPTSAARVLANTALVLLLLLLFSRKAYATYLVLALFPLCFVIASSTRRGVHLAYLSLVALAPVEPSLWFRWFQGRDLRALWTDFPDPPGVVLHGATFLCVEVALVACYAVLLVHAHRAAGDRGAAPATNRIIGAP